MGQGEPVKLKVLQRKCITQFLQKHIECELSDEALKELFMEKLLSSVKLKLKNGVVKVRKTEKKKE